MNKITIKGAEFALQGETIKVGSTLNFKAKNIENKDFHFANARGHKIISIFPDINTRVCDLQTHEVSVMATKNPSVRFLSITMDGVEVIKEWCAAKGINNLEIVSDEKYHEFANATNLYIPEKDNLARGFIFVDNENKIIDMAINNEISDMPDFDKVNYWIAEIK